MEEAIYKVSTVHYIIQGDGSPLVSINLRDELQEFEAQGTIRAVSSQFLNSVQHSPPHSIFHLPKDSQMPEYAHLQHLLRSPIRMYGLDMLLHLHMPRIGSDHQVSSTTTSGVRGLPLAKTATTDEVKTTLLTDGVFAHDRSTFRVPFRAGSIKSA
ncbi:glucans biosynthesis protein D [Striga asiatica]|uniref:Glucans biosynthesis protein D n=1 Tax=Striga asiatica TaxID=4170 RepID=A0A5A7Q1Y3_STRAF|nr:glucans biosynthesis protein D [Striga asiatica]